MMQMSTDLALSGAVTTKGTPRLRPRFERWSQDRDAQLLALAATGISMAEVGSRLGVSKSAAIARRWRLRRSGAIAPCAGPSMPTVRFLRAPA